MPLQGVTIRIKDSNIGTMTDESGNFRFRIPSDPKEKVLILEVSYVGYEKKTVKVTLKKDLKRIKIWLHESENVLGKWGVQFKQDRSLWEKFSGSVKTFFS